MLNRRINRSLLTCLACATLGYGAIVVAAPAEQETAQETASQPAESVEHSTPEQTTPEGAPEQPGERERTARPRKVVQQGSGPHAYLDWVAREELTTAQVFQTPRYCSGAYVEPEYVSAEARTLAPETQPLTASAISSEGLFDGRSTLRGDVVVQQGNLRLVNDQTIINRDASTADVVGKARFRQPGVLLIGDNAHLQLDTNEVTIENAEFVAHEVHMHGSAERIDLANNIVRVKRGQFTHCEPGANSWLVRGEEIELDQESGVGVARKASLRVQGVPVLYTPYIRFPLDERRKSGFLSTMPPSRPALFPTAAFWANWKSGICTATTREPSAADTCRMITSLGMRIAGEPR